VLFRSPQNPKTPA